MSYFKSRVRITYALALATAITFGAVATAPPLSAGGLPQGFTEQYISTLKQVVQADAQAYEQMTLVAERLQKFYARIGHFPDTDEERTAFQEWISKYISSNPYRPEIIDQIQHKAVATPYVVPLLWRKDESLNAQDFVRLANKPDHSWSADPGTIFILTNGRNCFLIWAASADRLPMRHLTTADQKPRMICREIESSY